MVKITSKTLKLGELNSQIRINNEDLPEQTKQMFSVEYAQIASVLFPISNKA